VPDFAFINGQPVTIIVSGETGRITARAEYANTDDHRYLVHYKAADGRAVEDWWYESQLKEAR